MGFWLGIQQGIQQFHKYGDLYNYTNLFQGFLLNRIFSKEGSCILSGSQMFKESYSIIKFFAGRGEGSDTIPRIT